MTTLQWRVVYEKECGDRSEECLEVTDCDFNMIFSAYSQKLNELSAKTIVVSEFLGSKEKEGTTDNEQL
ncbi:hypothetical protein A2380_00115 [candidate division WWE3 bacterium RIFOXYB1_FULL_43_24]|uniref:Uncharacterized protein n=2 Tax=Katanobacteria TaxID=422282 RepID=A0A0G0YIU9_UNCKA|nr:MAG: hypothetical protein UU92_C0022G0006 [candidate division WWE3 bacterium GW2011_GWA1_42_12]KKS33542.1 MAG: hypothetical protein UU97_C0027G0005 [candidate division WWE3 bacterium GW2011_GWD1_42_14]KKS36640.1 MAG: hypothetical protein UV00_C0025G0007 [candidate division WWE3 bacterium GW2011_GWF1_42_14]KKS39707.1 MAG: hypothetical protein UV03_C0023G0007 [candidate division WWE3 bacterium GW2011_GWE1_42_16]KKS65841.1 MAG: hypothetical protein UV35_C0031G0006 [candidate division WWE3 bacte